MLNPNDEIELRIDRVSYDGGRGVGRHDGIVVFVPLTAPEDVIRCRITKLHKNFAEAELIEVVTPSQHRRDPVCPVFGKCGGCRWQHFSYEEQLRQKAGLIQFALKNVWPMDRPVEVIGSPTEYRYRNRIQIHKMQNEVGYFAEGTHNLVAIDDCFLAEEPLIEALRDLKLKPSDIAKQKFEISRATGQVTIRDLASESMEFSQVNPLQNEELKRQVFKGLESLGSMTKRLIYDLYCGSGNFTFTLHERFPDARIVGIESHQGSIAKAIAKAAEKRAKVEFVTKPVAAYLKTAAAPDLAVVNPPRAGLENTVLEAILKSKARNLVYISCNLSTLARDLQKLQSKFNIDRVVGVDMFPQTEYVESVVHLSRK